MNRSFVHLHNHSEYSLLDGSCRLGELVETAREFGQPAVAITDHGNLFAALKFYRLAKAAGVKPIIGVEAYMAVGSRLARGGGPGAGRRKPYHHMILLARDYAGYRNLLKLVSRGYTEGFYYKPRIDREILAEHAEGLIGTSGCLGGEIPQLLLAGQKEEAEGTIRAYQEILGSENFFLELQDQGIPEEHAILPDLRTLSRRTGAPLLATNDCHYLRAADHFAHDVLICIQTGKTVEDPRSLRFTDQHYFKSSDEMWERFRDIPEALENTLLVAERCNLDIPQRGYQLPHFQVPGDVSPEAYFRRVVEEGYEARGPRWARWRAAGELKHSEGEYRERLQREMDTIIEMGFPGYFLIVWDLIRHARQEDIPVGPGRGSAAGSLVAYCLGITDLDPLKYDLLFERFLNPERISLPDIDIDFCVKGRGRVIDYVTEKYGRENVAQIITFGTMAARAVIRDAGRGLNIPFAKVDRIAKLVPMELDATIESSLESVQELKDACGDPDIKRLLEVARRLEGLARHASTHAAGVVIAPAPITEFAPLYQVKEGERTTQYSMGDLEFIGLLKMDFLGLKTLTLIDDVVKRVSTRLGQEIDFDSIGIDDTQTYELFARGATSGLFQFESDGMKDILRKLKPERFEDLIALNALYRPGPLKGGLVDDFIKRRHGRVQVEYIVPELRPILEETYGVMVYQEQVMKIASELGGFSLGDADLLRRAMGKKDVELLAAQKKTFMEGTRRRGLDSRKGEKIFEQMEHFAGYGFNKSHSAAYALVAYQTGYLKAHFPLDFMASLLTAEGNNTDKLVAYLAECRDMSLEILPPDIALSLANFSAEGKAIRFGLSAIKNAGEGAVEAILAARERLGTIHSLQELVMEVEQRAVNRRVFEAFIKSGCLDSIYPVRARLMAGLDRIQDMAQKARQDQESGQGSLFGAERGDAGPALDEGLPEVEPWTDHETLAYEKESLGFYVSGHPLQEYAREVADFGTHTSADLRHTPGGEAVAIAGMISAIRKRKTRKGDWMAVLTLEDLEGLCEVVLFPDLTASSNEILVEDAAILVTGRAESQGGEDRGKILAEEILPLSQVRHKRARAVAISLEAPGLDEERLLSLRHVLEDHKGGVPVVFVLTQPSSFRAEVKPSPELRVSPGDGLTEAVEAVLGPGALKLRVRA